MICASDRVREYRTGRSNPLGSRYLQAAISVGKAAVLGNVKYLILHVTALCNARCRMCFNWDHMAARRGENAHTLEDLVKLAHSMKPLPQLTLSGGEPLLRQDVSDILRAFYEGAGTRFFSIPTNALLPRRVAEVIERFKRDCPRGFLNFCLPFHGVGDRLDDIMGVPGNYQCLGESFRVIRETHAKNISCNLNFVMSKFNWQDYKKILDTALRDFPLAPIGIAYARGLTHERDAVDVPIEAYEEAHQYLAARCRNKSRYNPYTIMFDAIGDQVHAIVLGVLQGAVKGLGCKAGKNLLVIYDDGSVHPCELLDIVGIPPGNDAPPDSCLGNLHDFDYDLRALLADDRARRVIRWIATHECACTWECAAYSKIVNTPAEVARLGVRVMKYLAKRSLR